MATTPDAGDRGVRRRAASYRGRLVDWLRIDAAGNERGALSPAVVILAVMIFALAGLVIDGGRQLGARSRAVGYAQEAARAGVGTIDFNSAQARIDVAKAGQAVGEFCATVIENDPAVTNCAASELDAEHLRVQVQIDNKTSFLGMVGIQNLTANGEGEAHAEQGVTEPDETQEIPPLVVETRPETPDVPVESSAGRPEYPCPIWTTGSPRPTFDPPIAFPTTCEANASPTDDPDPDNTGEPDPDDPDNTNEPDPDDPDDPGNTDDPEPGNPPGNTSGPASSTTSAPPGGGS